MAPSSYPTCLPVSLVAGGTLVWDTPSASHTLYGTFLAADGWVLTHWFVGRGEPVEITGVVEGSGWRSTMTAAQSAALKKIDSNESDTVHWYAQVSLAGERYTLTCPAPDSFNLSPDPATQACSTSFAQQMVDALRAALKSAGASTIISYTVPGRGATRESRVDCEKQLAKWESALWREQHPGQLGPAIAGRFT